MLWGENTSKVQWFFWFRFSIRMEKNKKSRSFFSKYKTTNVYWITRNSKLTSCCERRISKLKNSPVYPLAMNYFNNMFGQLHRYDLLIFLKQPCRYYVLYIIWLLYSFKIKFLRYFSNKIKIFSKWTIVIQCRLVKVFQAVIPWELFDVSS